LQPQPQSLVPVSYFMVTFTLPAELRGLAFSHQRVVYALLMQCAWETLNIVSHNAWAPPPVQSVCWFTVREPKRLQAIGHQ